MKTPETETTVAAGVRQHLRSMLEKPLTAAHASEMLRVVQSSLALLRTIKAGRATITPRRGGPFVAGFPTSFGVMPLSDLYADATLEVAFRRTVGIAKFVVRGIGGRVLNKIHEAAFGAAHEVASEAERGATLALEDGMRERLAQMLEAPFTIPNAVRIERFLMAAVPLLQVLGPAVDHTPPKARVGFVCTTDDTDPAAFGGATPTPPTVAANPGGALIDTTEGDESSEDADEDTQNLFGAEPPAWNTQTSPPNETFGARMIREIMAALPLIVSSQKQTPEAMVLAIASAEREGMPKLAAKLRRLMGVEKPEEKEAAIPALLPFPLRPPPLDAVRRAVDVAAELSDKTPEEPQPEALKEAKPPKCSYMYGGFGDECPKDARHAARSAKDAREHFYCHEHHGAALNKGEIVHECMLDACTKIVWGTGKCADGLVRGYCRAHHELLLGSGTIHAIKCEACATAVAEPATP
jgi:hypothetical protein